MICLVNGPGLYFTFRNNSPQVNPLRSLYFPFRVKINVNSVKRKYPCSTMCPFGCKLTINLFLLNSSIKTFLILEASYFFFMDSPIPIPILNESVYIFIMDRIRIRFDKILVIQRDINGL